MNVTRNGKIARLPKTVREEFNRRLENGEPAGPLVAWLNGLPEVLAVLAAEFGGKPIREQNISEWRKGGYRDWLAQQEALALAQQLAEDAVELKADGRAPLTDALALWLAARYAVATRQVRDTEGAEGWRLLRELCADIVELRRGDHSAERLRLEQEQLAFERERDREKNEADFLEWAMQWENRDKICEGYVAAGNVGASIPSLEYAEKQNANAHNNISIVPPGSYPTGESEPYGIGHVDFDGTDGAHSYARMRYPSSTWKTGLFATEMASMLMCGITPDLWLSPMFTFELAGMYPITPLVRGCAANIKTATINVEIKNGELREFVGDLYSYEIRIIIPI